MIKLLIVLSTLTATLAHEYDIMNNLVDFEDTPYRRIYPYRKHYYNDNKILNLRTKLIKNAIVEHNGFSGVTHPVSLISTGEVMTSLSNLQTSFMATINAVVTNVLNWVKSALKLLSFNVPAVIFGAVATVGFCKITSVCSKFNAIHSIAEAMQELVSFITTEKLNMVTEYLNEAIRQYGSLLKK